MSASLYLTDAELADLTGARRKSLQIEWLRANRWKYRVSREGFPRVAREHWRSQMVGDVEPQPAPMRVRPNFAVIKGAA